MGNDANDLARRGFVILDLKELGREPRPHPRCEWDPARDAPAVEAMPEKEAG